MDPVDQRTNMGHPECDLSGVQTVRQGTQKTHMSVDRLNQIPFFPVPPTHKQTHAHTHSLSLTPPHTEQYTPS